MKTHSLVLTLLLLTGYFNANSQETRLSNPINAELKGLPAEQAIDSIEHLAGISIAYDSRQLDPDKIIETATAGQSVTAILKTLFGANYDIIFVNDRIVIKTKPKSGKKTVLYGYVTDAQSGESLPGATIYLAENTSIGAVSNVHGYYSLTIPEGTYQVVVSYMGFETITEEIQMNDDLRNDYQLKQDAATLAEIVVTASSPESLDHTLGTVDLDMQSIKVMPAMAGEPDPIKLLQLTPGVKSGGEGSSGLFVRGGNQDQNLILLDDAPVYNPSHLLGFFSVFHPDALKNIQFFKSNIPIEYGDRLSSVLDVRMKDGDKEHFGAEGGIGLLSTRVLLEGPISKSKSSYMVALRRTYPDLFLGLSSSGGGNKVNFTDANMKLNFRLSDRDNLFVSAYFGNDQLRFFDQYENSWGNHTTSLRWHHLYGNNVFGNLVAYHSKYQYAIETFADSRQTVDWKSAISESSLKYDFALFPGTNHQVKFGIGTIWRHYDPGQERSGLLERVPSRKVTEYVAFAGHTWDVTPKFRVAYGARINSFHTHSEDDVFILDENRMVADTLFTDEDEMTKRYHNLSPRVSINYQLNTRVKLEASYNRNVQFQHEIRNASSPFNAFYVWLPSGFNLPQGISDQFTLGYQQVLSRNFELSVEAYYKHLQNQIDYKDHASIIQNHLIEQELRIGKGRAYGLEVNLEKTDGRLTGWLQYTFSRTTRQIQGINNGEVYPAFFDQPHAVSIVTNYDLTSRAAFGLNWQYASGQPVNLPVGTYYAEDTLIPIYEGRNNDRLPEFHRLDLSYTLRRKPGKYKNQSYWVFSLINVYYRKNALSLDYLADRDPITGNIVDPLDKKIYKTYIFGLIPSVSWNFKF